MKVGYTLYNMLQLDKTIFDNIKLYEKIDKEICVNEIITRCISLPVNCDYPEVFKTLIEHFFKKNYDIFRELYETLLYEYNPIENYDRQETSERIITNEGTGNSETENKISAMDSSEYQPDNTQDIESKTTNNGSDVFNSRIHGNIGVTTSQQMIEAQRKLVRYDFYVEVATKFENELCVSNYGEY